MVSCHRHVQVIFQVPRGKTDIIIVLSVSATFEIVIKLWHLFRGVIGGHVSKTRLGLLRLTREVALFPFSF